MTTAVVRKIGKELTRLAIDLQMQGNRLLHQSPEYRDHATAIRAAASDLAQRVRAMSNDTEELRTFFRSPLGAQQANPNPMAVVDGALVGCFSPTGDEE